MTAARGPSTLGRLVYAGVLLVLGFTLIAASALGRHAPQRPAERHEVALVSTPDRAGRELPVQQVREPAPLTVTATVLPRQADAEATDDILAGIDAARADTADTKDDDRPALELPEGAAGASSAAARTALTFALAQVGKPYVWGATGPDSYDCSGLTWRAYATAGISLPRVSRDQHAGGGTPVAATDLRPGDLVFFATAAWDPGVVHHVGMYVGRGQMVNAPHPGASVRVEPVPAAGYVGAVRVTGSVSAVPPVITDVPVSAPEPSSTPTPTGSMTARPRHSDRPTDSPSPTPAKTTRWPSGPSHPSSWPHPTPTPSAPPTTAPATPTDVPTEVPTVTPTVTPTDVVSSAPPVDPAAVPPAATTPPAG